MRAPIPTARGFTLLEVLVALTLLTLFAITSYRALNAVLESARYSSAEAARWQALAAAFARIQTDLRDAVPAALPLTSTRPGFVGGTDALGSGFALDRQLPNDVTAGLQRVTYRYMAGRLLRSARAPTARTDDGTGETVVLDGLSHLDLSFLDGTGQWRSNWPPGAGLPSAVAMDLERTDGLRLRRVFLTQ